MFKVYAHHTATRSPTNGALPVNAWETAGPAASDLRSDTMTSPTLSMLAAIQQTTLLDDVYSEDPTTNSLESFIAELTGKPAAMLVLSGTMGNQVALRTHLQAPPHALLTDQRGHIINYEAGGVASLSGAMVQGVTPKNGRYLTLEDVQRHAVVDDDIHSCPTKVISLENTLNGMVMPLDEVRRISKWARANGILVHMDGARLWEACASGAGELKDYCDAVDSVSLCFSKGLGAPIGSIIAGTQPFIKRARWIRKSIGGGLRQAGVVAAPARVAVEETFLGGRLTRSHEKAKQIARAWEELGGTFMHPVETNMVWLDLEAHGVDVADYIQKGQALGLRISGNRLVIHYQISDETVDKLCALFREVLKA